MSVACTSVQATASSRSLSDVVEHVCCTLLCSHSAQELLLSLETSERHNCLLWLSSLLTNESVSASSGVPVGCDTMRELSLHLDRPTTSRWSSKRTIELASLGEAVGEGAIGLRSAGAAAS